MDFCSVQALVLIFHLLFFNVLDIDDLEKEMITMMIMTTTTMLMVVLVNFKRIFFGVFFYLGSRLNFSISFFFLMCLVLVIPNKQ